MPITIGLDISTKTGVYVYGEGVAYGKLIHFPKYRGMERLQLIANEISRVLDAWQPDLAVIEAYAHQHNIGSFVKVVECGTVIRLALYQRRVPWVTVSPTTLKLWTTGCGRGKKDGMIASVKERWGFESSFHDIVDAYALAQFGQLGIEEIVTLSGVEQQN